MNAAPVTEFADMKMIMTNAAPDRQTAAERLVAQAVEQGHPHRVADATTLRSIASLLRGMS